ncbi:MAG: AAA family ATPase [bacterium]|nr:AAA family ATPase [bacterium]
MARIITIANQKGGVGKTTTTINLSTCLCDLNKKVLLIDIDPQGNTTSGLGYSKNKIAVSIYDLFSDQEKINQAILNTSIPGLSLIPANISLTGAEIELVNLEQREFRVKSILDSLKENYDYIFIDCPPSLGLLTINGLTAANSIIIPVQCAYYAMEGLGQLLNTIKLVKDRLNRSLKIEGILLTMYDARTNLSYQVAKEIKTHFREKVYETIIPTNVKLAEAPGFGKPITLHDNQSTGAKCYQKLAEEVIRRNKNGRN